MIKAKTIGEEKEKVMNNKTQENPVQLLSEGATARFAGVALGTLQRYRKSGKIKPEREVLTGFGTVRLYRAEDVKRYFETDPDFLAAKASRQKRVVA